MTRTRSTSSAVANTTDGRASISSTEVADLCRFLEYAKAVLIDLALARRRVVSTGDQVTWEQLRYINVKIVLDISCQLSTRSPTGIVTSLVTFAW